MNKIVILFFILFFNFKNFVYSSETDCNNLSKISPEYIKCKASLLKQKSLSSGKNIIDKTKKYQKDQLNKSKKTIDKGKKNIQKGKDKIIEGKEKIQKKLDKK